jgi:formylmethanofuran dehydrogenase subunit B
VAEATCAGCGCLCDDIELTADGPVRTCPLGDAWFAEVDRPPVARIDGREVSLEEAADAAAAILREARAPLVYGLGGTSCEAQRRAVALAEAAGAVIDVGAVASAAVGSSTATFGEIRDRAELVVFWRADPAVTHPRLLERLRIDPAAMVVVDSQRTATADAAGAFVEVEDDFEALWALRGGEGALVERLRAARHVAFVHGALDELTALALHSLVRDLAHDRHAVTLGLRDGNARGAEDVLAWQTGFSATVDFARGFPREGAVEQVDAALVVAADLQLDVPTVAVDARATSARVAFATAADGIEVAGTAHRMDGVPIPLRAPRQSDRPSIEDVLAAIEERL